MPYDSIKSLPAYVKKYSDVIQRQFMHVFNSVYKKTGDEKRAFQAANSVLKKRFEKTNCMLNNTREDYVNLLVDNFLGNLKS